MTVKISEDSLPVGRLFYLRDTLEVAKDMLGLILVRKTSERWLMGRIVETEAYRGSDDPASHAFRGMTKRNEFMFGKPGCAYVYFTYGAHYCLNVVTERTGIAAAVLIRAIEPLSGLEIMMKNRGVYDAYKLTNGPGKLTKALLIGREHNGVDLTSNSSSLIIVKPLEVEGFQITRTTRIGIKAATDRLWRFYIRNNMYISTK